jgi:hypothetical protein
MSGINEEIMDVLKEVDISSEMKVFIEKALELEMDLDENDKKQYSKQYEELISVSVKNMENDSIF